MLTELNRKRAKKMIKLGKMTRAGLAKFKLAGRQKDSEAKDKPIKKKVVIPSDLKRALSADKKTLENFNNFAPSYRRLYIAGIIDAKRKETREKSIKQTVKWAAGNRKGGMM